MLNTNDRTQNYILSNQLLNQDWQQDSSTTLQLNKTHKAELFTISLHSNISKSIKRIVVYSTHASSIIPLLMIISYLSSPLILIILLTENLLKLIECFHI